VPICQERVHKKKAAEKFPPLDDLIQMLGKLIRPYAVFMLRGIEEGKIQNRLGITVENAEKMSAFILYGIWGLIYNDRFTQTAIGTGLDDMEVILRKLFY
jgi:hypothetical protein